MDENVNIYEEIAKIDLSVEAYDAIEETVDTYEELGWINGLRTWFIED